MIPGFDLVLVFMIRLTIFQQSINALATSCLHEQTFFFDPKAIHRSSMGQFPYFCSHCELVCHQSSRTVLYINNTLYIKPYQPFFQVSAPRGFSQFFWKSISLLKLFLSAKSWCLVLLCRSRAYATFQANIDSDSCYRAESWLYHRLGVVYRLLGRNTLRAFLQSWERMPLSKESE